MRMANSSVRRTCNKCYIGNYVRIWAYTCTVVYFDACLLSGLKEPHPNSPESRGLIVR